MKRKSVGFLQVVGVGSLVLLGGSTAVADPDAHGVVYSPTVEALAADWRAAGQTRSALHSVELLYSQGGWDGLSPHTLIANNRTHLISSQFVERDPRRGGRSEITYLIDQSDGSALSWNATQTAILTLTNAVTEAAIDRSMAVWGAMSCNGPALVKIPDPGTDPDVIDDLVLGGPVNPDAPYADITHAGWLPASFFNRFGRGILGATFTFIWLDENGRPTDIDRDGRADVAYREIYYNRGYGWGTNGLPVNVDIESVVIHEAGHAFGLGHFGRVTLMSNGQIHHAPKAIMNAVYIAPDRTIRGTDVASFCHAWAPSPR
jgi:hypothetical protein